MFTFTVKMSNEFTGKNKVRTVQATGMWEAERKARSNVMMANGWVTDIIEQAGNVVWQSKVSMV